MTTEYRWLGRIGLALLAGKLVWVLYTQTIEPWWFRYPMLFFVGVLLAVIVKIDKISELIDRRNEGEHEDRNEQG